MAELGEGQKGRAMKDILIEVVIMGEKPGAREVPSNSQG